MLRSRAREGVVALRSGHAPIRTATPRWRHDLVTAHLRTITARWKGMKGELRHFSPSALVDMNWLVSAWNTIRWAWSGWIASASCAWIPAQ